MQSTERVREGFLLRGDRRCRSDASCSISRRRNVWTRRKRCGKFATPFTPRPSKTLPFFRKLYDQQAKERQKRKPANSVVENFPQQNSKARDAVGKAVGVSGKSIDHAAALSNRIALWKICHRAMNQVGKMSTRKQRLSWPTNITSMKKRSAAMAGLDAAGDGGTR